MRFRGHERLRDWLRRYNLDQYADRFAANDGDLDILPALIEQASAESGVSLGNRRRLMKAIAENSGAFGPTLPADEPAFPSPSAGSTEYEQGWKDILLRVYRSVSDDRILANTAGVTFYAFLGWFPAMAALVSIYGLFSDP